MVCFVVLVVVWSGYDDHDNGDDDDFGGVANEFAFAWLILIENASIRNTFRLLT